MIKEKIKNEIIGVTIDIVKKFFLKEVGGFTTEDKKKKEVVMKLIIKFLIIGNNTYSAKTYSSIRKMIDSFISSLKKLEIKTDYLTDDFLKELIGAIVDARKIVLDKYRGEHPILVKKFSKTL